MALESSRAATCDSGWPADLCAERNADGDELSTCSRGAYQSGSRLRCTDLGWTADDAHACACSWCRAGSDCNRTGTGSDCAWRLRHLRAARDRLCAADLHHQLGASPNHDLSTRCQCRSGNWTSDQCGAAVHDQHLASAPRSEHLVGRPVASLEHATDGRRVHACDDCCFPSGAHHDVCSTADDDHCATACRHAVRSSAGGDAVCSCADGHSVRTGSNCDAIRSGHASAELLVSRRTDDDTGTADGSCPRAERSCRRAARLPTWLPEWNVPAGR